MSVTQTSVPERIVDLILNDPHLSLQQKAAELILLKELYKSGKNGSIEITQAGLRELTGIGSGTTMRLLIAALNASGRWHIRSGYGPFTTTYNFLAYAELPSARKGDQ